MAENKTSQYATKEDVRQIVQEAADAIISGIDNILKDLVTKEDLLEVETKLSKKIDNISKEAVMKKDIRRVFANQ